MIDLLLVWLWAPVALLAACVGLSLLLERAAGLSLPWGVRPALGLAAAIVIAQVCVSLDATAEAAAPLVLALGGLGLAWGALTGRVRGRPHTADLLAAAGVFLVFAAPVLAYGDLSWAGYGKLDDTATWMGLADHAFTSGPTIQLEPSTFEALVEINAGNGYPVGSLVPMKLLSTLSGQDVAWTVQPSMAFMALVLTLLLAEVVRGVSARRWVPAAIAFLGAQAALLVGFALWGGVKEVAVATLLPLGPLLVARGMRAPSARVWLLLGAQVAAVLACVGPGGAVWVAPTAGLSLVLAAGRIGWRTALEWALGAALLAATLGVLQLAASNGVFSPFQGPLTSDTELGALAQPLSPLQAAGVWPSQDLRLDPQAEPLTRLAAVAVLLSALWAAWAMRRRGPALFGYVVGALAAAASIHALASPWIDSKALATLSPALLAGGLAGAALLLERRRVQLLGAGLGTVIAALVLWGSFLAYRGAQMAPRDQMAELEEIGEEFAGQGPTLFAERNFYAGRHFLRRMDAEGEFDLRRRPVLLASGEEPDRVASGDIDEIAHAELAPYRTLVVPRGPASSRPPSDFTRVDVGDHYEVWQRAPGAAAAGEIAARMPLGASPEPAAVPECAAVRRLAAEAGAGGALVAAAPRSPLALDVGEATAPPAWQTSGTTHFLPVGPGRIALLLRVERAGEYEIWLGGDVFAPLEVGLDYEPVATVANRLDSGRLPLPVATVDLTPGAHVLTIDQRGPGLGVGSVVEPTWLGPLIVDSADRAVRGTVTVPASEYEDLCGRRWDWIEAHS